MDKKEMLKLAVLIIVPAWLIYNFICYYQIGGISASVWRLGYYLPSMSFVGGALARHFLFFEKK